MASNRFYWSYQSPSCAFLDDSSQLLGCELTVHIRAVWERRFPSCYKSRLFGGGQSGENTYLQSDFFSQQKQWNQHESLLLTSETAPCLPACLLPWTASPLKPWVVTPHSYLNSLLTKLPGFSSSSLPLGKLGVWGSLSSCCQLANGWADWQETAPEGKQASLPGCCQMLCLRRFTSMFQGAAIHQKRWVLAGRIYKHAFNDHSCLIRISLLLLAHRAITNLTESGWV